MITLFDLHFFLFLLPLLNRHHHRCNDQQSACTVQGVGNSVLFPSSLFPAPHAPLICTALLPWVPFLLGLALSRTACSHCARERRMGQRVFSNLTNQAKSSHAGPAPYCLWDGCWRHIESLLGAFLDDSGDRKLQSNMANQANKTGFHPPQRLLLPGNLTNAAASFWLKTPSFHQDRKYFHFSHIYSCPKYCLSESQVFVLFISNYAMKSFASWSQNLCELW